MEKVETIGQIEIWIEAEPETYQPDYDDAAYNRRILKRAENNVWAWCSVKVTARVGTFEASDYLGGCSYRDQADFVKNSQYYDDMKIVAIEELFEDFSKVVAHLPAISAWLEQAKLKRREAYEAQRRAIEGLV